MNIYEHNDISSLDKILNNWSELNKDYHDITIFQDVNWLKSWWEYKTKQRTIIPYILEIKQSNEIVGVFPLYIHVITLAGVNFFLKTNRIKVINKPLYYYRASGITSKYMPYFFDDIVNGYEIQKEVIDEYYIESKHFQYKGISIMLLNTFKTALKNLFDSDLKEQQIKDKIKSYVLNESIQEAAKNDGSISYFPSSFLTSIESKDIDYLYTLGYEQYKSSKPRKRLVNFITKISAF